MNSLPSFVHRSLIRIVPLLLLIPSWLPAQPTTTKTAEVLVTVTMKPGITRDQILKVLPEEVRATVSLYLDGKIRDWYSRSDGKGVILIMNAASTDEARALADSLPLSKANLVEHEYIELGPLAPLRNLIAPPAAK
jgi:hypothetical protein